MGEIEFRLAVKGLPTRLTVLDLHNVYGWPCVYADSTSQVIPALVYRALSSAEKVLKVWGDGSQGRAFVHVDDVVKAVELCLDYRGEHSDIMIGPEVCTRIRDVAEVIQGHPQVDIESLAFDPSRPTGDIGRYANNHRARSELGWSPSVDLVTGIHRLIDEVIRDLEQNASAL